MPDKPAEYPELPKQLRERSLLGLLTFFGPGAIIACVTIGSGETIFASRIGSLFGYSLLWCFLVGAVIKAIQVYSGCRFITLTGRHPLESWMDLPGPRGAFVWLISLLTILCMPFFLGGALPRMLGDFTNWVFGYPDPANEDQYLFFGRLWGTAFTLFAVVITWLQTYRFLERVQTAIVGLLVFCMVSAAVFSNPDLIQLIVGFFVPVYPAYEPWVVQKYPSFLERHALVETIVCVSVIGGGTVDYFGYLGMLREKGWGMLGRPVAPDVISESPENVQLGLRWLRAPLVDVCGSFALILTFTACFAALGATVLHPQKLVPDGFDLLTLQASYLVRPDQSGAVQALLGWVYKTGIFFAFFGTIYGAYELYTRTVRECLSAVLPRLRNVPLRKFRLWTIVWTAGAGLLLLWFTTKDPVVLITPAALLVAGITCGLWCFAMLWSDRVHVPPGLRMRWPLRAGLVVSGILLTVCPIVGLVRYVQDLMK